MRKPGENFINAIAQDPLQQKPDYAKALEEYLNYADTLRRMGVDITLCEADEQFPDGLFAEDNY